MWRNFDKVLSTLSPRQRVFIIVLSIFSTTVITFVPSDGPIDKVINLFDSFTYDDTEMKRQLKLQKERLKDLVIQNDSLNQIILNQSLECTDELMQQNQKYKNKISEIRNAFNEHELEEETMNKSKSKPIRITVRENNLVDLKYDTIIQSTVMREESPIVENSPMEMSSPNQKKSWFRSLFKSKEIIEDTPKVILPPSPMNVTVKTDTILKPKYQKNHSIHYDTVVVSESDSNQIKTNKSLKKLKDLISKDLDKK